MKTPTYLRKPPLFFVILALIVAAFACAAAVQLWSTSRLADQIIEQEIGSLTKQTHTSLQLFMDNQLQSVAQKTRSFASYHRLLDAMAEQDRILANRLLSNLYNSENSGGLELLFLMDSQDKVWLDASSPFFSALHSLESLPLDTMKDAEWYVFNLPIADKSQIILLRKEAMVAPETGEVLGSLAGGIVLSGRISMLHHARRYIDIAGLALMYNDVPLAQSSLDSLDIRPYLNQHASLVENSLNQFEKYYVGYYPIKLEEQTSDLQFVTLVSSASFDTLGNRYKSQGVIQALVILLLALLTTAVIITIAVRPLIRLITVARQAINAGEEMTTTTTVIKEYSALDSTLRNLIHSSNQQKSQLQNLNAQLEHQVENLEKINLELDNFAYVASHDLKSPLRGIGLLAGWISQDLGDSLDTETAKHLALMHNRISRMEKLLDDLLTYSKVGRVKSELCEVDCKLLLEDIFALLSPPKHFQLNYWGDFPSFTTFRVPLEQVFRNLLSNAIKHNDKEQGVISITAKLADNCYQFTVSDNGPGIPKEHQKRVFGMYQTLRPRDEVEGSGMGLALVKKIVELYGGTITLHSDGESGTDIAFTWPIKNDIENCK